LIKPNNLLELEKTIINIINNKKLYKSLTENSINHIKKNFDIKLVGKRYDMIITELYDSL
jgi:glycosyltransferase involved in cell wall biosynthesis